MSIVATTIERVRELLSYDPATGVFHRRVCRGGTARAGSVASASNGDGYICIRIDGRKHLAHRVAWLLVHGVWPDSEIDHINGARDDNRIANLRPVTHRDNAWNQKKPSNNTSGTAGVSWHKRNGAWLARININGKPRNLGCFISLDDAIAARKAAERAYGYDAFHGMDAATRARRQLPL